MKRLLSIGLLMLGLLLMPASVRAQRPGARPTTPYRPPVFSPYLNLLRRDANPAVNYYGLVRPEKEFRQSLQALQQEINGAQLAPTTSQADGLPITGHPTQFMNYSHYYPRLGTSTVPNRGPR